MLEGARPWTIILRSLIKSWKFPLEILLRSAQVLSFSLALRLKFFKICLYPLSNSYHRLLSLLTTSRIDSRGLIVRHWIVHENLPKLYRAERKPSTVSFFCCFWMLFDVVFVGKREKPNGRQINLTNQLIKANFFRQYFDISWSFLA